ncbi:VOC family protein [Tenggerimyces flavus]|uniref:VOC family protein n=1 Tax=Tenggerimyces flavus TaxID=1708749 RepID=A0ABV7YGG0_9ACTN|nr:VOC family protein [Tenggerimyces flavus]MBM7789174.1 catechol 2,3-dioxygenase-like lactoylglutathione lyase family enzyme [Tenggerimyces flavus]
MITRIHSTTVLVSDQDKALAFYIDKLDWEKRADSPFGEDGAGRWLTVAPEGAATELVLGTAAMYEQTPTSAIVSSGISLTVEDLDATYATLTERGVAFEKPPETMPWGTRAAWLRDPDGNTFFLSE